jgi:hypothetical protein
MFRCLMFLSLAPAVVFVAAPFYLVGQLLGGPQVNVSANGHVAGEQLLVQERVLNDQSARRARFAQFADQLTSKMADGQISMREATERVFYYCLQQYPEHLENVLTVAPGKDVKIALADNLVASLEAYRIQSVRGSATDAASHGVSDDLQVPAKCEP